MLYFREDLHLRTCDPSSGYVRKLFVGSSVNLWRTGRRLYYYFLSGSRTGDPRESGHTLNLFFRCQCRSVFTPLTLRPWTRQEFRRTPNPRILSRLSYLRRHYTLRTRACRVPVKSLFRASLSHFFLTRLYFNNEVHPRSITSRNVRSDS